MTDVNNNKRITGEIRPTNLDRYVHISIHPSIHPSVRALSFPALQFLPFSVSPLPPIRRCLRISGLETR